MRDLNMVFLELYKRTDRFIKDAYSSSDGISVYLCTIASCFNNGITPSGFVALFRSFV